MPYIFLVPSEECPWKLLLQLQPFLLLAWKELCSVCLVQDGSAQTRAMAMAALINYSQRMEYTLLKRMENKH